MSIQALNWAFGRDLPMAQKFVLVALANYADERHSCFPGQKTLADQVGASERTVRRAVEELESLGLLARERRIREGGYRTSDRYVLAVATGQYDRLEPTGQSDHRPNSPSLPANLSKPTGHSGRAEPSGKPPENHQSSIAQCASAQAGDFDALWAIYPSKRDKKRAKTAYEKALQRATPQQIQEGVQRYADDPNLDPAYAKYFASWLNGDCWEDGPLPERRNRQAQSKPTTMDRMQQTALLGMELQEQATNYPQIGA